MKRVHVWLSANLPANPLGSLQQQHSHSRINYDNLTTGHKWDTNNAKLITNTTICTTNKLQQTYEILQELQYPPMLAGHTEIQRKFMTKNSWPQTECFEHFKTVGCSRVHAETFLEHSRWHLWLSNITTAIFTIVLTVDIRDQ